MKCVKTGKKSKGLLLGLVIAWLITVAALLILAFLVYQFGLDEKNATIGILGIYVISCFLGGMCMGKTAGSRKFLWGTMLGILYFLLLLLISLVTRQGIRSSTTGILTGLLMCAGAGCAGGMAA